MNYNKKFKELLDTLPENEIVGLGNPNSKILFIGKEPGTEIDTEIYHGSVKSWKEMKHNYAKRFVPDPKNPKESKLRHLNHTWQKYQKVHDTVLSLLSITDNKDRKDKYEITFVENVFTSELSNLPARNTRSAKKQPNFVAELSKRKLTFFKSEFIQSFPVIVIFATDNKYIETYPGEVCELFNVKFDKLYNYSGKDKIWLHSSSSPDNNPKLLIHTRQLTNSISKELIISISEIIAKFIQENSLNIITTDNQ